MNTVASLMWSKLENYVGCEEEVDIRRRTAFLLDNILFENIVQSGSRAEGLDLPGSDIDFMGLLKSVSVQPCGYSGFERVDLVMETHNTKPGFTWLKISGNASLPSLYPIFEASTVVGNNLYISSLIFRDSCLKKVRRFYPESYPHGPCTTHNAFTVDIEADFVHCLSCKVWPEVASEWTWRNRPNNWPPSDLVESISNGGCLLVPIGNPLSPAGHMEWRLSFSIAEKTLVHSMNHTQFLCYALLKLFLKHVIEERDDFKGVLCSYFMKTCLFYCIEEEPIIWNKNNLLVCFWTCYKRLIRWVREENCPNYFVKHNNMFEGKIYGDGQQKLLEFLSNLYHNDIYTLLQIPIFQDLQREASFSRIPGIIDDGEISKMEKEYRCDREIMYIKHPHPFFEKFSEYEARINTLYTQTEHVRDVDILNTIKINLNYQMTEHIYNYIMDKKLSNKANYKLLKMLRNYILYCVNSDICSGLLQYATLCYIRGRYCEVVSLTGYVLSKFKPYTMYNKIGEVIVDENCFKDNICGKGLNILQKMKEALANTYIIVPKYGFYPCEIKNEILHHVIEGAVTIPPVVYCNVLLFLSYSNLGSIELRNHGLDDLFVAVNETAFICDIERPLSYALYRKCLQIAGSQKRLHLLH